MLVSYAGMLLGYVNKGLLFIWLLSTEEIGLINLLVSIGLLFGNLSGLGSTYAIWKFFPFLRNPEKKHHGILLLTVVVALFGTLLFTLAVFLFRPEIAALYGKKSALFVDYYYWIIPLGFANVLFLVLDAFLRSLYYNVISVFVYELVLRVLISVLLLLFGTGLLSFDSFLVLHCLMYFVPVVVLACYSLPFNPAQV
jgi:O-antigen/teichoic acid export membrane protein